MAERDRPPLWRKLFAIADAAVASLADEWQAFFRTARTRVRRLDLTEELAAPNILPATQALRGVIEQTIERPARRTLPGFTMQIVEEAGDATTATLMPSPLIPLAPFPKPPYVAGLAETEQWVQQHIGTQIRNITDTTMQTIRQTLQDGWREGVPPRALARQLRGNIGLTPRQAGAIEKQAAKWQAEGMRPDRRQKAVRQLQERAIRQRAETIARTETLAYSNYGSYSAIQQYIRRGLVDEASLVRRWTVTPDSKLCPECAEIPEMNPDGVGFTQPFETPFGPKLLPPAHPTCVTGDTLVLPGGRITAVSKRWYDGEVIVLRTAQEKHLTCTPNHPILTLHGWIAAGELVEGGKVLCYSREQGIGSIDQNVQDMPACIEEIVEAFRLSSTVTSCEVPITPEAFHGDGKGSHVAVIGTNRLLRNDVDLSIMQHGYDQVFKRRCPNAFLLACLSNECSVFNRLRFSASCVMSSLDLMASLFVSHVRPFEPFSFVSPSWDDLLFQQAATDDGAGDLKVFSKLFLRDALPIECGQLVSVQRQSFRGHVFNLQTELGWYLGNEIITHNCRCAVSTTVSRT